MGTGVSRSVPRFSFKLMPRTSTAVKPSSSTSSDAETEDSTRSDKSLNSGRIASRFSVVSSIKGRTSVAIVKSFRSTGSTDSNRESVKNSSGHMPRFSVMAGINKVAPIGEGG